MKLNKFLHKYSILSIFFVILIIGSYVFFNNYQKKQDYAESFEKKGELILSQLEASTKNLLWNYNHSDLKKVTKAIGQDKEVAIINIYNSNFQFIEKVSIDK